MRALLCRYTNIKHYRDLILLLLAIWAPPSVPALFVSRGSNCSSSCESSQYSTNGSSPTNGSDIVCLDKEYESTVVGKTFINCVGCELNSPSFDPSTHQTDQLWAFFNLRYALGHCLYGFPETNSTKPNSCSRICTPLLPSLRKNIITPGRATTYDYCQNPAFETNIQPCIRCYSNLRTDQQFISNFLKTLQFACNNKPSSTQDFPIPTSVIFNAQPLNESAFTTASPTPSASSASPTASTSSATPSPALSAPAKAAIAICVPVGFFLIASFALVFWYIHHDTRDRRRRRRRYQTRSYHETRRRVHKPVHDTWSDDSSLPEIEMEQGHYYPSRSYVPSNPRTIPHPVHRPDKVSVPPRVRPRDSPIPFSRDHINMAGPLTPILAVPPPPPPPQPPPSSSVSTFLTVPTTTPPRSRPRTRPTSGRPDLSPRLIPLLPRSKYQPPPRPSARATMATPPLEEAEQTIEPEFTRPATPVPFARSFPLPPHPLDRPRRSSNREQTLETPVTTVFRGDDPRPTAVVAATEPSRDRIREEPFKAKMTASSQAKPPKSSQVKQPTTTPTKTTTPTQVKTPPSTKASSGPSTKIPTTAAGPSLALKTEPPAPTWNPLAGRGTTTTEQNPVPGPSSMAEKTKRTLTGLASKLKIHTSAPPPSPTNSSPATSPLRSPPGLVSWDRIAEQNKQRRRMMGPSPSPISPLTVPTRLAGDRATRRRGPLGEGDSDTASGREQPRGPGTIPASSAESRAGSAMTPAHSSTPGSIPTPMRLGSPALETIHSRSGQPRPHGAGSGGGMSAGSARSGGGRSGGATSGGGRSGGVPLAGSSGGISGGSGGGMSGGSDGTRKKREVRRSRDVDYDP